MIKNILYGLLAIVLYSGSVSAQTLMSDEEHRIMMNNFAIEVNNVLTGNCPQGITVDQYKRGIVDGTYTLSQMMQDILIINYTQPLKDYGSQFAAAKGLTANTDALKYFYSSFAPSTVIQNGKLIESTTSAGLTATEMWTCALETFGTDSCGSSVLVSDKSNLSTLATTSVNKLTAVPGNIGVLVMLNGFGDCIFQPTRFRKFFNIKKTEKNIIVNLTGITINPVSNQNDFNFSMANEIFNYNDGHQVYIFNSIENPSSQMIIKFDQSRNIETAFHIIQEQCNMKYYNFRYTITDLIDETSVTYQIRKNDISYTTYSRLPGESFNDCFVRTWTEFAQDTLGIITSILAPREIAIAVALSCAIPNNPPVENPSQKPVTFTLSK